jgi:hypothetical protein
MAKKHPNKEIRAAIAHAVEHGWTVKEAGSSSIRGGKFIVRIGIQIVDVVSSASRVFGVLPKTPRIMPNKLEES